MPHNRTTLWPRRKARPGERDTTQSEKKWNLIMNKYSICVRLTVAGRHLIWLSAWSPPQYHICQLCVCVEFEWVYYQRKREREPVSIYLHHSLHPTSLHKILPPALKHTAYTTHQWVRATRVRERENERTLERKIGCVYAQRASGKREREMWKVHEKVPLAIFMFFHNII